MDKHTIRTSETDSVKGIKTKQKIDIQFKQTSKALPYPNVSTTINQRSLYEEERQAGNKFRLIVTIVPYCSNVLFNALTEIVRNEGSNVEKGEDRIEVVTDMQKASLISNANGEMEPTRTHMISNTEYSSPLHGNYTYHPGYDFFDNHILRNKSFKIVNPNFEKERNVFNTLEDFARDINGNKQNFVKRKSIKDINEKMQMQSNKHLYIHDDIMSIDESINQNLYEENGWWGFNNKTSIDTKKLTPSKVWESMEISRALNNYNTCEFIDMYPDRTLYSFIPKYNPFTKEQENNWNVVITYPYKNVYNHPICLGGSSYIKRTINSEGSFDEEAISEGNRWMGLKVMSVKLGTSKAGSDNVIFRTYTKHGLSRQDSFYLYYTNPYLEPKEDGEINLKYTNKTLDGTETYYESQTYYQVTNIGDLSRNNDDYFFYVSNMALLKELYKSYLAYVAKLESAGVKEIPFYEDYKKDDKKDIYDIDGRLKTNLLNNILSQTNFRIKRCVNGIKSTYYIRLFRKVPNLRAAKREMTDEEKLHLSKFNGVFDNYIADNALDPNNPKYQRLVNNEQYQMAFAKSIFNDNITQITFSDGIDTEGLTDNLGRPLSELFYTIVKNNAGHEVWYNEDEPLYSNQELKTKYKDAKGVFKEKYGVEFDDYKIEYSHCFGKVTSGFEMFFMKEDTEQDIGPIDYLKKLSSAHHIANIVNIGSMSQSAPIEEDIVSRNLDDNITYKDTFFYGDLVEFNPMEAKETVLSNVMHRFNTAQRELINNKNYSQYQYHEITQDDYDPQEFTVSEYSCVSGKIDNNKGIVDYQTIGRPEGYIYKAHYPIQIREYTSLIQNNHYTLRVRGARPIQKDGILIEVTTTLPHRLNENDIIFICDDETDTRYITKCVGVINTITFLMSPYYTETIMNATNFEDVKSVSNLSTSLYNNNNNNNVSIYKTRLSWLELCEILNGKYDDDLNYPQLVLRRKNNDIPDYATYIGSNMYCWRDIINIGDNTTQELPDYIFANGYFYVTSRINFFLKRQDPFGTNGLYFDDNCFPNDPSGILQQENKFIEKETNAVC